MDKGCQTYLRIASIADAVRVKVFLVRVGFREAVVILVADAVAVFIKGAGYAFAVAIGILHPDGGGATGRVAGRVNGHQSGRSFFLTQNSSRLLEEVNV